MTQCPMGSHVTHNYVSILSLWANFDATVLPYSHDGGVGIEDDTVDIL